LKKKDNNYCAISEQRRFMKIDLTVTSVISKLKSRDFEPMLLSQR